MKRLIVFLSLVFVCSLAYAARQTPYIGKCTGSNVNVRAKPNTYCEVITQLNKNQEVQVIAETKEWVTIVLPKKATVWLLKENVADGTVIGDRVAGLSGPGENFTTVCTMKSGDKVKVRETLGNFTGIEAPETAIGFVSKQFVRYYSTFDGYAQKQVKEKEAKAAFAAAEQFEESELTKAGGYPAYEEMIARYRQVAQAYDDCEVALTAEEKVAKLSGMYEEAKRAGKVGTGGGGQKQEEKKDKPRKWFIFF